MDNEVRHTVPYKCIEAPLSIAQPSPSINALHSYLDKLKKKICSKRECPFLGAWVCVWHVFHHIAAIDLELIGVCHMM